MAFLGSNRKPTTNNLQKLVTREHRFLLNHLFYPTICCVVEQLAERILTASALRFPANRSNPFLLRLSWRARVDRRDSALLLSFIVSELWYCCCFLISAIVCLSEKDRTHRKPESS